MNVLLSDNLFQGQIQGREVRYTVNLLLNIAKIKTRSCQSNTCWNNKSILKWGFKYLHEFTNCVFIYTFGHMREILDTARIAASNMCC